MKPAFKRFFPFLSAFLYLLLTIVLASAQSTRYWDGGTADIVTNGDTASSGGDGTWNTTLLNWDAGASPHVAWVNTNNDIAIFGGTAGTVTLGSNITASILQFDTTGYTIGGSSDLTFAGATRQVNTSTGVSATISARIVGGNTFTKVGTGTLTLSGNNTLSGGVSLGVGSGTNGGITIAASNTAFGTGTLTLNQTTGGDTILRSDGTNRTFGNSISQAGSFTLGGSSTGNLTFTNTLSLGSLSKTLTVDAISVDFQGNITRGSTNTYTKSGSGTLIISGNASGFGNTTGCTLAVSAGTALINGTLGNGTTNIGNASVASGATLGGSGTIHGTVNVTGVLAAGNNGVESLRTRDLTFNNNSTYAYQSDRDALPSASGDLTAVTGALNLTSTVNLTLQDIGGLGSWAVGDELTLIGYSGVWNGGLFTYLGNAVADDSTFTFSGIVWNFNYNDTSAGENFTGDLTGLTSFVTMTAIPEPSVAMLGGFGLLMLIRRRR